MASQRPLVLSLLMVVGLLTSCSRAQQVYQFGVGMRDCSPTDEMLENREVWLGGYGFWKTRGVPQGVHDPIWSRAWVVDDGNTTMAFATIDSVGNSNRILKAIREGVEAATGIPSDNVHVSATHSHSGPDLQGLWGGFSENYRALIVGGSIDAIVEAYESRRPAYLYASQGNGTQYNRNRRGHEWTHDNIVTLDAIDASTGDRIGTVINFAAHPVALGSSNKLFSGDWCHYTREYLEQGTGAPAIFVNGPIGDVSPSGCDGPDFEGAEVCGGGVGTLALQYMNEDRIPVSGPLFSHTYHFTHDVSNRAFVLAYYIGWLDYDADVNGTDFKFDTLTSYIRIGDTIEAVAFPGESLTRNAEPVMNTMTAPVKMFFGLTGDTLGYLVPSDEWDLIGGYEEKVSIHKDFGDFTRDLAIEMIETLSRKFFSSSFSS